MPNALDAKLAGLPRSSNASSWLRLGGFGISVY